jgi:hypothetical protein
MSPQAAPRRPGRVVLVRPWSDARTGSGCCGGEPDGPIAVDHVHQPPAERDAATRITARCYLLLRERFPELDVQIVSSGNMAYLLPATYAAARHRVGVMASLRACIQAPTAGALLVDGERVGDLVDLGPEGTARLVAARLASGPD